MCGWGGAALSPPQREAQIAPQHQTLGNVRSTSCYGRGRAEAGSSELTCRTLDRYRTTFLLFFHLRTVSDEDSRHASPGPPRRKKMPVSFFALSNPAKKVENSVSSCPEKLLFLSFFLAPSLAPSGRSFPPLPPLCSSLPKIPIPLSIRSISRVRHPPPSWFRPPRFLPRVLLSKRYRYFLRFDRCFFPSGT